MTSIQYLNMIKSGTLDLTRTFDAENKILKLDTVLAYAYDGEGKRVRKYVGENTRFVYGIGGELLAEYNGSTNAITKEYLYGASGLTAVIDPTNGTEYLTPDHLGSPRVLTNSSATVTQRRDFMPFGEEVTTGAGRTTAQGWSSASAPRQKFTGYERDDESGLDFAQARYYNSKVGRFTTTDPILISKDRKFNPQEINLFAYCKNNPLAFVDPHGEIIEWANKESKRFYDDFKKYINAMSDDNPDKVGLLATIKQLEDSGVTYVINVTTQIDATRGEVEGRVSPDESGEKIMVNVRNIGNNHEEWTLNSRLGHELTHAQEFDNGEIGFEKRGDRGWSVMAFDHFDEVNAYRSSIAIARTNGSDNTNPKLRGILRAFEDAKGDAAKELEAYRRFTGKSNKEIIRQSNIQNINFYNVSDGIHRPKFKGGMQIYCNRGCGRRN